MQDETQITYGPVETVAVEHSTQVGDLMTALAKAQAEMDNPANDTMNRFQKRYASKAAVRNATVPHLAKHGIAITQHPVYAKGEGWAQCVTMLWHGEQWLKSTLQGPVIRLRQGGNVIPAAQLEHTDYTAIFTYLSRVALKSLCGVSDEEDEEGEREGEKRVQGSQRPASPKPAALAHEQAATINADTERQQLLTEVWDLYKESIMPLRHAGMHKAIFYHSFHIDKPEHIKEQSLETLQGGMALYRHLTAHLVLWDRQMKPDAWIGEQQRQLATQAAGAGPRPEGIDPLTGEDLRDMPDGWLTDEEQREQQERENADLLDRATA